MEHIIDIIGNFFEERFSHAMFMWVIAGGFMALIGALFLGVTMVFWLKGEAVSLRVIALHREAYKPKDGDTAEDIALAAEHPRIRPEFEILDGTHAGRVIQSSSSSNMAEDAIGDVVMGRYMKWSDELQSERHLKMGQNFGLGFVAIGLGIIALAKFMSLNALH